MSENKWASQSLLKLNMQFFGEESESQPEGGAAPEAESVSEQPENPSSDSGKVTVTSGDKPDDSAPENSTVKEDKSEPAAEEPKKYSIKHNKQTYEFSEDEIRSLAEKGLDYDRVRPAYDFAKELAEKSGINDVSQYIESARTELTQAEKSEIKRQHSERVQRFLELGYQDDVAEEMATTIEDNQIFKMERQKQQQVESIRRAKEEKEKVEAGKMQALISKHPEVVGKDGKLNYPDEALKMIGSFEDNGPMAAYELLSRLNGYLAMEKEYKAMKAEKEAASVNSSNASASTGSVTSGQATEGEITSAQWDKLSPKVKTDLIKSGKIYEYMKKWGNQ